MNQLKALFIAPVLGCALLAAQAQADDSVAERLRPVGTVCIQGQECLAPGQSKKTAQAIEPARQEVQEAAGESAEEAVQEQEPAAPAASSAARSGEEVYQSACVACHAAGVAGAPVTGDQAAWQARFDAEGGIDGMLAISKAGKGAMPAMGTCASCSDDELVAAIKFMSDL